MELLFFIFVAFYLQSFAGSTQKASFFLDILKQWNQWTISGSSVWLTIKILKWNYNWALVIRYVNLFVVRNINEKRMRRDKIQDG